MRKITFLSAIFAVIFITTPLFSQESFTQRIVAIVNGEAITQTDIDEILAPIYLQYKDTYQGAEHDKKVQEAREDVLKQLIDDKLILQQAKKSSLKVEEKEVDKIIEDLKKNFASDDDFERTLKSQNLTVIEVRKRYREQLLIKKIVGQEVISKILISPAKISDYYEKNKEKYKTPELVRLRNIFLSFKDAAETDIEQKANQIYAQLQSGTPFVELVEKYSEAPNVVDSGDMGFMKRGSLREEIEEIVFNLNPGEYTKPIKTPSGYYLFRVEDKKASSFTPLDSIKEQIRSELFQTEVKTRIEAWLRKIKESSLIEVKANEKKEG